MRKRKYKWGRIAAAITGIVTAAIFTSGFLNTDTEKKELIYTVQSGDTVWSIAEQYHHLNTSKYILEFQYEIHEANPEIKGGLIYPGQKIIIPYEVAKNE